MIFAIIPLAVFAGIAVGVIVGIPAYCVASARSRDSIIRAMEATGGYRLN